MDICSRNKKLTIRRPAILVALALLLCSCKSTPPESMVTPPAGSKPPATTQQSSQPMRGIWLATVSRLDWPPVSSVNISNPTSRARVQQQAMIDKLDHLQRLGINTVFFQVKPDGTALWPSKILPWSDLMTGKIGENPGYDPLQFMLDEAHKRGMKVHAWFNPYRVSVNTKPGTIRELNSTLSQQPASVYVQHRDWIRTSGDRFVLDPGIPEVQDWITSIVAEVVSRYPVDGVQFDDYFYTESPGSRLNDNETYRKYGGAFASKADWRRNNTQQLIAKVSHTIKSIKPGVEFGVSPAGVWRNFFPATLELAFCALLLALLIGIPLGILSAVWRNRWLDHLVRIMAITGISTPAFWLGLGVIVLFYGHLQILPGGGRLDDWLDPPTHVTGFYLLDALLEGNGEVFFNALQHLILPALTLAFVHLGIVARQIRSAMLEQLSEDYIRTARASGLPGWYIVLCYALPNALIPSITVLGLALGDLLYGAVLTETVFAWPGMGAWVVTSIQALDFPAVMGFAVVVSFAYVLVNLVVDLLYLWIDPRIGRGGGE